MAEADPYTSKTERPPLHGTHFQVESRSGGRNVVYPYEAGWRDTVLLLPLETVAVL